MRATHRQAETVARDFLGFEAVAGITFTMGGVSINGRGEILDKNRQAIPGLYAGGDTTAV